VILFTCDQKLTKSQLAPNTKDNGKTKTKTIENPSRQSSLSSVARQSGGGRGSMVERICGTGMY